MFLVSNNIHISCICCGSCKHVHSDTCFSSHDLLLESVDNSLLACLFALLTGGEFESQRGGGTSEITHLCRARSRPSSAKVKRLVRSTRKTSRWRTDASRSSVCSTNRRSFRRNDILNSLISIFFFSSESPRPKLSKKDDRISRARSISGDSMEPLEAVGTSNSPSATRFDRSTTAAVTLAKAVLICRFADDEGLLAFKEWSPSNVRSSC